MEIRVVFELRGRFYVTVCSFLADTIKKYNLLTSELQVVPRAQH